MVRDVGARQVRHGNGTLRRRPAVILTLVPSGMGARPTMIRSRQIGETQARQTRADAFGIHAERRDYRHPIRGATQVAGVRRYPESSGYIRGAGRLQKDRDLSGACAALEREIDLNSARIGEAAHTAKGAELMVERAVLLHQDNDVLNITNRACAVMCRNRERLGDIRVQRASDGGHAHQLQEFTTVGIDDFVGIAHGKRLLYLKIGQFGIVGVQDCGVRNRRRQLSLADGHVAIHQTEKHYSQTVHAMMNWR